MPEAIALEAADGWRLGATLFDPGTAPARVVQIQAATGVPQEYYGKFAAYLASRGMAALTFDYRGIGRSRAGSLRGTKARMRDWALLDAAAALGWLEKRFPGARLMAVGHSFGGQCFGLLPRHERLAAVLSVGSQSGYWRNWHLRGRLWMWPAVHVGLPALSRLLGYFPGSRLGFGEDLPAGVAEEWASWCRHPRYMAGALGAEERFARFDRPFLAYAVTDDAFAPPRAVRALLELYPNARSELRIVSPRDAGVATIGHFGFFRERFRDSLWRGAVEWLEGR